MNKRKLIKRLAWPAAISVVVSIIVLISLIPISDARNANHKEDFKKYINSFVEQNKNYLKGVASRIKSLPVDPVMVSELQSEYMIDHQNSDAPKKYLWMSNMNGEFLFGAPSDDFQRLNSAFDKYQPAIKADEYYRDRNDFLAKLIDRVNDIDFSQFEIGNRGERDNRDNGWRYYKQRDEWGVIQPTASVFSTPVYDNVGKLIGQLYMKVDDMVNLEKYKEDSHSDTIDAVRGIFIGLLVLSGIFLWFLLPTWVYIDAQDRDVKNPGIWAFLTLTSLFFGLVIYIVTRPNTLKSYNCPKCDGELNGTRAYCPHCGYDLANTFCQQCQYPIKPEWQFCPNCRAEIKAKEPNTAAVQTAGSDETGRGESV